MYVVAWEEHLPDGREDGAKVVETIAEAEQMVQRLTISHNVTCAVFELGKKLALTEVEVFEPQPSKVTKTYKVNP